MSILQNLHGAIEIEIKKGEAWLEDMNHLANSLDLTADEMNEAANLLKQLKMEQAKTNGIRRHRKLLITLSRYS